jgi:hypothetical protein
MTETNQSDFIQSNVWVFYRIAKESFESMKNDISSGRRPKPNGEPGWIITYDPEQKSYKAALVVIVFSGMFLEALLHLLIVNRKGIGTFKSYDGKKYEEKLRLLGCTEESILSLCENYRQVRREIVHEKAHLNKTTIRFAQKEAESAITMITRIADFFKLKLG